MKQTLLQNLKRLERLYGGVTFVTLKFHFHFFFFEKNHPVRHKHIAIFVAIHRVNLSVNLEPMRL